MKFFSENRLVFKMGSGPEVFPLGMNVPDKIKGEGEIRKILEDHPELTKLLTEKFPEADEITVTSMPAYAGQAQEIRVTTWEEKTRKKAVYFAMDKDIVEGLKWAVEFKRTEVTIPDVSYVNIDGKKFLKEYPEFECWIAEKCPDAQEIDVHSSKYLSKGESARSMVLTSLTFKDHIGFVLIITKKDGTKERLIGFDDNGDEQKAISMLETQFLGGGAGSEETSFNGEEIAQLEDAVKQDLKELFYSEEDLIVYNKIKAFNRDFLGVEGLQWGQKVSASPFVVAEELIKMILKIGEKVFEGGKKGSKEIGLALMNPEYAPKNIKAAGEKVKDVWEKKGEIGKLMWEALRVGSTEEKIALATRMILQIFAVTKYVGYLEETGKFAQLEVALRAIQAEKLAGAVKTGAQVAASPFDDIAAGVATAGGKVMGSG